MKTNKSVWVILFLGIFALSVPAVEESGPTATQKRTREGRERVARNRDRIWSFDGLEIGKLPRGWQIAETQSRGTTATWQIMEQDGATCLACTETVNKGNTFNLVIARRPSLQDVDIELKVKALSGKQDQGGGPIWRAQDPNNYYIARWNPLEDNLRLYTVKDGKRSQLASAEVKADPKVWHTIEIEHIGQQIEVSFDDKDMLKVEDAMFTVAGKTGLWTKADAATAFDDLKVSRAQADDDDDDDGEHSK
ncbi:hypothetical protein ACFL6U_05435 [Planctomycetota bacterium]